MAAAILQQGCLIRCPHGGAASVAAGNRRVTVGGAAALLATDTFAVAGCPFVLGVVPSPCLRIQWQAPATRITIGGAPPLLETSLGTCIAATGAAQGSATVTGVQTRARGV